MDSNHQTVWLLVERLQCHYWSTSTFNLLQIPVFLNKKEISWKMYIKPLTCLMMALSCGAYHDLKIWINVWNLWRLCNKNLDIKGAKPLDSSSWVRKVMLFSPWEAGDVIQAGEKVLLLQKLLRKRIIKPQRAASEVTLKEVKRQHRGRTTRHLVFNLLGNQRAGRGANTHSDWEAAIGLSSPTRSPWNTWRMNAIVVPSEFLVDIFNV